MSKKGFGQVFAIATLGGLIAAGISYVLQYKAYHKELEEEFHNFEEDEQKDEVTKADRKYIALSANTDEFVLAAKETANAAKGMATAAKGLIKDVSSILKDQASSLKSVATDSAELLKEKVEKRKKTEKPETKSQVDAEDIKDLEALDAAPDSNISLYDNFSSTSTNISEQNEGTILPNSKKEDAPSHNVTIKDAKLNAEESTVIDLSDLKDEDYR